MLVFLGYPFSPCWPSHAGSYACYSSIGSNEKSALLSAPHTDHRLRSLLLLRLFPRRSNELRLRNSLAPSPSSLFCFASSSSNMAASSASGVSSIVSKELIEGDRDRNDVGVLGMLDAELKEDAGYRSYAYFGGAGDGDVLPDRCGLTALACNDGALALWCSGLVGRRRVRGKVFGYEGVAGNGDRSPSAESSSSACSGMFGSMFNPLHDGVPGYDSSIAERSGLRLLPACNGDDGLRGAV